MPVEKKFFLIVFEYFYVILKLKIKLSLNIYIWRTFCLLVYSDYHYNIYGDDTISLQQYVVQLNGCNIVSKA